MKKNTVRQVRHRRSLSQEELARRCGISRQFLGLIEAGKSVPTIGIAMKIARELDATLAALWPEFA